MPLIVAWENGQQTTMPFTPDILWGLTNQEIEEALVFLQQQKYTKEAQLKMFTVSLDHVSISPAFRRLLQAAIVADPENREAVYQAAHLVSTGAVTWVWTWVVRFNTINSLPVNHILYTTPYDDVPQSADVIKRDIWTGFLWEEHGVWKKWMTQKYLNNPANLERIVQELAKHDKEIASYNNFFWPILQVLPGNEFTKRRTIQLLTNIHDWIILADEPVVIGDNEYARRPIVKLKTDGIHFDKYDHDFNFGSLYTVKKIWK